MFKQSLSYLCTAQETIQDFQVSVLQVSDGLYDERLTKLSTMFSFFKAIFIDPIQGRHANIVVVVCVCIYYFLFFFNDTLLNTYTNCLCVSSSSSLGNSWIKSLQCTQGLYRPWNVRISFSGSEKDMKFKCGSRKVMEK